MFPYRYSADQPRQNPCTITFVATFAKTASVCNSTMEKCQDSIKSTAKNVKSLLQKGANPEKSARRGYETIWDYLDFLNKRILIQQRALACISKALAHIFQRELYSMGNTNLLRCEAEMTHLCPHLGDSRCQELRSSPFWPAPLFRSQLVKDGEEFLLKKILRGLHPIKTNPSMVPTIRKEAPTGNAPMEDNPLQTVTIAIVSLR